MHSCELFHLLSTIFAQTFVKFVFFTLFLILCLIGVFISRLTSKGGAIALEQGRMRIENSRFINNSATTLGGSIFSDRGTVLELRGTYMEFPPASAKLHPMLYSLGNTSITNSVFNASSKSGRRQFNLYFFPFL